MSILSLSDCASMESHSVGKKAYWLGRMLLEHENVPNGICIPSDYFFDYISSSSHYDEIVHMVEQIERNKIYGRRNLAAIRKIILSGSISDTLFEEILTAMSIQQIDLKKGVSVRSSSANEDSCNMVFAGVYTSFIDVETEEDLKNAIIGVWASQFSEASLYYEKNCFGDGMAVIIQQMKHGDLYGVMFTKSPTNSSEMLIEAGNNTCDIVDGQLPEYSVNVDRENGKILSGVAGDKSDIFSAIAQTGLRLEMKFNMFCDIEWTYSEGQVYLLQCRPLANTVNADFNYKIFSQDDKETCDSVYLGTCQQMYQRYLGKQYIFRKAVLDAGYSVYRQYYVIFKHDYISDAMIHELEEYLDGAEFLIIEFSRDLSPILCRKAELRKKLEEYNANNNVTYIYCRIGEIIDADLSGYSSITSNGGVFVEYVPGRLTSLIHGFNFPAQLVIKDGKPEYTEIPSADTIEGIDQETGKKAKLVYGKQYPELTQEQILVLDDFTKKLATLFPDIRLEWYFSKGKLYGKDLSIENNALTFQAGANFMSDGHCEGTVFRIGKEQLELLDELALKYDVSLYHHSKKELELYKDKQLDELARQILERDNAVLVAERPSIGILGLAGCAKGMIFKKGAVLSHVGIFLREQHIPAVIDPKSYENLIDGSKVAILEDGSVVLDKRRVDHLPEDVKDEIDTIIKQYDCSGKLLAVGIQGGYGRGLASSSSDIDLLFLFRKEEDALGYPKGFIDGKSHEIEIKYISLDKLCVKRLEPKVRYIYANEVCVYYDPSWELARIITEAGLSKEERLKEIVLGIRKLETIGIIANEDALALLNGFHYSNNCEYWFDRGDDMAAHMWLNVASERVARIIFAINGFHLPSNKWRYHTMMSLPWIPNNMEKEWERANCYSEFSPECFATRKSAYQSMLSSCVIEAYRRGLLPDDFYMFYNKTLKSYTDNNI